MSKMQKVISWFILGLFVILACGPCSEATATVNTADLNASTIFMYTVAAADVSLPTEGWVKISSNEFIASVGQVEYHVSDWNPAVWCHNYGYDYNTGENSGQWIKCFKPDEAVVVEQEGQSTKYFKFVDGELSMNSSK